MCSGVAKPHDLLLLKLVDTKRVELFTDALQVRLAPTEHVCPNGEAGFFI